jgi:hypothetical protein
MITIDGYKKNPKILPSMRKRRDQKMNNKKQKTNKNANTVKDDVFTQYGNKEGNRIV